MEVDATGQKHADSVSARPGHSEHQTGLAADLGASSGECALRACFGDMPEGKWLAANAYRYGFIIRYQKGATPRTGYAYEPWHLRYVGKQLAAEMQRTSVTLEEYFHLPAYPDYPGRILKLRG
jgi:D-alanyl-D-alanine carboxypeptidase